MCGLTYNTLTHYLRYLSLELHCLKVFQMLSQPGIWVFTFLLESIIDVYLFNTVLAYLRRQTIPFKNLEKYLVLLLWIVKLWLLASLKFHYSCCSILDYNLLITYPLCNAWCEQWCTSIVCLAACSSPKPFHTFGSILVLQVYKQVVGKFNFHSVAH